jgi:cyclophilin family peptidyl-prolyl cis-trans isomerase
MMGSRGKLTTNRIELAAMLLQQRLVIDPVQRRLVATIIAQLEIPALPKELEDELIKAMYNEIDGEAAALLLRSIAQLRRPPINLKELDDFWRNHSAWEVRTAYAQWYGWKDDEIAKELSLDPHQQVRTQIQHSLASAGRLPQWREETLPNDASISSYQKQNRGENSLFEEAHTFVKSWKGDPPEIFDGLLDASYPTKIRIATAQVQQDRQVLYDLHTNANEIELRQAAGIRIAELSTTSAERKALLNNGSPEIVAGTASVLAKDPKGNSEKDLWAALNTEAPDWMNLSVMHALLSIHKQGKSRSFKDNVKRNLEAFVKSENPAVSSLAVLLMEAHDLKPPKLVLTYPSKETPLPCGIRLQTTAGEIRISLNSDESPNTIGQIQNLISDNKISQVNLFTPQHTLQIGQSPPQNYILDEHNLLPFERGTVGIALRTPNSGGSQIFISFRERPDFIGEYTNIGHVTYGMETLLGYPYSKIHSTELEHCNTEE